MIVARFVFPTNIRFCAGAHLHEPVLVWNHEAVPGKFDELCRAAGLAGGGASLVPWQRALKRQAGIVGGLAAQVVEARHLDRLAELATADFTGRTNPRTSTAADYRRFFEQAN